jgi:N-acetylmuramoyl-L-alanine amidase
MTAYTGKIVIVDPGHGGSDPGATAEHDGKHYQESEITMEIALRVECMLRRQFGLVLTRRDDYYRSPSERYRIVQLLRADAFVSIHCNAGPKAASGIETLYRDDDDLALAQPLQGELVRYLKLSNRGVRQDEAYLRKKITVLTSVPTPSVLVEVGFLTSPKDIKVITDVNTVALAITKGIQLWHTQGG